MRRVYLEGNDIKKNKKVREKENYKSIFGDFEPELIFNATGRNVNIVEIEDGEEDFINCDRIRRLAKGDLYYVKEIYPEGHLSFEEGNMENTYKDDIKIHIENVDFTFDRIANEDADELDIIIVEKEFADNINNVINRMILKYGADSKEVSQFLAENKFLDKLYVEWGVVLDSFNDVVGCLKLKKALMIIQDLKDMYFEEEDEEDRDYLVKKEILKLKKDMVKRELANITYMEKCLDEIHAKGNSVSDFEINFN